MTDIPHNLTPEEIDAAFLPEPLRDEKVMKAFIPGPPEMAFMSLIGCPVLAPTIPPLLKPLPPENDLTQLITSSDTQHTKEVAGPPPLTKEEKKALAALKKEQLAAARALKQEIKRAEEEAEAARLEERARRGIQEDRLAAHHVADWLAHHRHIQTEDQWIEWVCNNPTVINQKKQGNCLHFPCHNIPGSYWDPVVFGWRPRPYLLVLPSPTTVDMAGKTGLSMNDQVSAFLRFELESAGIPLEDCQVTYACRFALPAGATSYNAGHKDSCAPYLQADVEHCRPRAVLTFGSDALKGLLGEHGKLATYRGEVADWKGFPIVMTQTCKEFMSGYGGIEVFRAELRRARDVAQGNYRPARLDQSGYRVVDSVEKMRELLGEVEAAQPKHLAFDFEFGSKVRREEYTVDRSCQVSWAAGRAAFIKLLGPKGEPVHSMEDYAEMVRLLGVLLGDPRWRLDGHHARVDFNRAWRLGIGMDDKLSTAFCTLLVFHLLHGDDDLGLDQLCRRYIPEAGSYWRDLELWLDANGRTKQLEQGYLNVPDEILIPYGLADADVTWRIAEKLEEELKAQPALWDLYWNISAPAALHIMDVERQGLRVDDVQRMRLRGIIEPEYRAILSEFRELVNWPEFDPAKREQIASYLYSGTHYKDKKVAPPGVRVLDLQPPFNTDKYPREWVDIEAAQENHLHSPSTKSTAIDLLATEHPEEVTLKYLKFMSCLGKFLNTYLTRVEYADPQPDEELAAQYGYPFQYPWGPAVAPLGLPKDGEGFAANICDDGRVRGHIHQTSETGRWRMSKVNLQVSPKKQETALLEAFVYRRFGGMDIQEYFRRTNDKKAPKDLIPVEQRIDLPGFKSIYVPDEGNCLIEVDFKTAEICVWAYCSGDPALTAMIEQGRDIHCETATACFNLPVADELREALAELNGGSSKPGDKYDLWAKQVKATYEALRTVSKSIMFGLIYGRGASALSREINKQGVETTPEACQKTIDGIAKAYPKAWQWLKDRQAEAIEEGWVTNAFGFRRYFSGASMLSNKEQAKIKRQAGNASIQGCLDVDSVVSTVEGPRRFTDMSLTKPVCITDAQEGAAKACQVIDSGVKPTVRIYTESGANLRLTADHRVRVITEDGEAWVPAGELQPGVSVVKREAPRLRAEYHQVEVRRVTRPNGFTPPQHIATLLDERFGFVLGFQLGDGNLHYNARTGQASTTWIALEEESEPLTAVAGWLDHIGVRSTRTVERTASATHRPLGKLTVGCQIFADLLHATGVLRVNHDAMQVPTMIFDSPVEVQLAFVDGYLTADGTVTPSGSISWVTKSEQFAHDFANLLSGLGLPNAGFKDGKGYWRGNLSAFYARVYRDLRGFRHHPRKQAWLETRSYAAMGRQAAGRAVRFPLWLSRQCLPEGKPANDSAEAMWYAVRRGAQGISRSACQAYAHLGFKVPEGCEVVVAVKEAGECQVADLSVITEEEAERRFVANGFEVHNCVAQLLNVAGTNLYRLMYKTPIGKQVPFKILLGIHDAYIVECKIEHFDQVNRILGMCMSTLNKIPGTSKTLGVDFPKRPMMTAADH